MPQLARTLGKESLAQMVKPPKPMSEIELGAVQGYSKRLPPSPAKVVCKSLGHFMSRASGGAVWSNHPCTDLGRAPAE
jgi:hypothetical protein